MQTNILIESYAKKSSSLEIPGPEKVLLKNEFYVKASGTNKHFKFILELRNNIILFRKVNNEAILGFMDIDNTIMLISSGVVINGKTCYGIKFIKKGVYEIIFTHDEDCLKNWFFHLKKFCFLIKFKLYYRQVKILGRGNFA